MPEHDNSYKLLFSHPEMVEDLLRGFVHEPWVAELDFSTLEKVSGSFVSLDLRDREDDVIWRVRWGKEWLYVYLLLEFQSTIERFMAVRVMTYLGLLYQDLIRRRELAPSGLLPPVLPLVLYNGAKRWSAAEEIAELVEPMPEGLEPYRPRLRYLLLGQSRFTEEDLAPLRNLVAALFRLENSRRPEDIVRVLGALVGWLHAPEQAELRKAFTVWLNRVLLPARLPGVDIPEVHDLQEAKTMLEERVVEWTEEWKREGWEAGWAEGRQEGESTLLLRQLERKFGAIPEDCRKRVTEADSDTILEWGDRILTAEQLDDVFAKAH